MQMARKELLIETQIDEASEYRREPGSDWAYVLGRHNKALLLMQQQLANMTPGDLEHALDKVTVLAAGLLIELSPERRRGLIEARLTPEESFEGLLAVLITFSPVLHATDAGETAVISVKRTAGWLNPDEPLRALVADMLHTEGAGYVQYVAAIGRGLAAHRLMMPLKARAEEPAAAPVPAVPRMDA